MSVVHRSDAAAWGGRPNSAAYVKTQQGYYCRPLWRACLRTPTLQREYRALLACSAGGIPTPRILGYRGDRDVAELVLEEIDNACSLRDALHEATMQRRGLIMERVGEVIGKLHNTGWTHGALGSPHILVENASDPGIWLIDFEKARRNPLKCKADLERFLRRGGYLSAADQGTFQLAYEQTRLRCRHTPQ